MRSLSKVEGLAALRLGFCYATVKTAAELAGNLPFAGGLYVSELALDAAVAALGGNAAARHQLSVRTFYEAEQAWFCEQLKGMGLQPSPCPCPFFSVRGPMAAFKSAAKTGAAVQPFSFPYGFPGADS